MVRKAAIFDAEEQLSNSISNKFGFVIFFHVDILYTTSDNIHFCLSWKVRQNFYFYVKSIRNCASNVKCKRASVN